MKFVPSFFETGHLALKRISARRILYPWFPGTAGGEATHSGVLPPQVGIMLSVNDMVKVLTFRLPSISELNSVSPSSALIAGWTSDGSSTFVKKSLRRSRCVSFSFLPQ